MFIFQKYRFLREKYWNFLIDWRWLLDEKTKRQTHTHTHTHTHTDRVRETDRQTDKETNRQRDRDMERHIETHGERDCSWMGGEDLMNHAFLSLESSKQNALDSVFLLLFTGDYIVYIWHLMTETFLPKRVDCWIFFKPKKKIPFLQLHSIVWAWGNSIKSFFNLTRSRNVSDKKNIWNMDTVTNVTNN